MNETINILESSHLVESQIKFVSNRIKTLESEISNGGDFGRSAIIQMFNQILVTLNEKVNDTSFSKELIRAQQEIRELQRLHLKQLENNLNKESVGTLVKLKKAYKQIDKLISNQVTLEDNA